MHFRLVTIREKGRRRSRAEIEATEPLVGDLVLRDLPASSNNAGRVLRYADLLDTSNPSLTRALLRPLFDPVIVRVTPWSMLLMGHELEVVGETVHEHVQGWLLRPI